MVHAVPVGATCFPSPAARVGWVLATQDRTTCPRQKESSNQGLAHSDPTTSPLGTRAHRSHIGLHLRPSRDRRLHLRRSSASATPRDRTCIARIRLERASRSPLRSHHHHQQQPTLNTFTWLRSSFHITSVRQPPLRRPGTYTQCLLRSKRLLQSPSPLCLPVSSFVKRSWLRTTCFRRLLTLR